MWEWAAFSRASKGPGRENEGCSPHVAGTPSARHQVSEKKRDFWLSNQTAWVFTPGPYKAGHHLLYMAPCLPNILSNPLLSIVAPCELLYLSLTSLLIKSSPEERQKMILIFCHYLPSNILYWMFMLLLTANGPFNGISSKSHNNIKT